MVISHWSILSAISILSSLSIIVSPARTETQQIDSNSNSQSNQTAATREIAFTISPESNQTFTALMQQAELLATNLIKREFTQNPSTTEIAVSILGERNGQEAPLLFSKVSRSNWQKQPKIEQWTQYFNSSAVLLGFLKPQGEPSTSPTSAGNSTQPPTSPAPDNSTQPPTSPAPDNSTQPPTSPAPGTSTPGGASIEENDPGYR